MFKKCRSPTYELPIKESANGEEIVNSLDIRPIAQKSSLIYIASWKKQRVKCQQDPHQAVKMQFRQYKAPNNVLIKMKKLLTVDIPIYIVLKQEFVKLDPWYRFNQSSNIAKYWANYTQKEGDISIRTTFRRKSLQLYSNDSLNLNCELQASNLRGKSRLLSLEKLTKYAKIQKYQVQFFMISTKQSLYNCLTQIKQTVICLNIDLGFQRLAQPHILAIAEALGKCTKLNQLKFSLHCANTGDWGAQILSNSIRKLQQLEIAELALDSNFFGDKGTLNLAGCIQQCKKLRKLQIRLKDNDLSNFGAFRLCQSLIFSQMIDDLLIDFSVNKIDGNDIMSITRIFQYLKELQALFLSFKQNNIGEQGARELGDALSNLKQLIILRLDLEYCTIESEGAISIGDGIEKCQNLITLELNMNMNQIQSEGLIGLANGISKLKLLKKLNLSAYGCGITNLGYTNFNKILAKSLKELIECDLSYQFNQIGEDTALLMDKSLLSIPSIKVFSIKLAKNKLTQEFINQISKELPQLYNLKKLTIEIQSNRFITTSSLVSLSQQLKKLDNLTQLDLNFNRLDISKNDLIDKFCQNLKEIAQQSLESLTVNVDSNSLDNKGPLTMGKYLPISSNLTKLYLNYNLNQISDQGIIRLGRAIFEMKNVKDLDLLLQFNQIGLEGVVQLGEYLQQCKKLEILNIDLFQNKICGIGARELAQKLNECPMLWKLSLCLELNALPLNIKEQVCQDLSKILYKKIQI